MKTLFGVMIVCFFIVGSFVSSQAYEVLNGPSQLIQYNASKAYEGYTLFSFMKKSFLIDMLGNVVHTWNLPEQSDHMILLESGNLFGVMRLVPPMRLKNKVLRLGGWCGGLVELDWDSNIVWRWDHNTPKSLQHHDFVKLPNGNVLTIVWEHIPYEEAIKSGRHVDQTTKNGVAADAIYEVNRTGEVVWKWRSWDHRGANASDKLDVNFITHLMPRWPKFLNPDWTHFNDVDYDPATDQILFESREFGEIYIIDHKTGKMVYRWGNPSAYGAGKPPTFTTPGDQILFGPHDAHWIKPGLPGAGNILIFNNGWGRPPVSYSSVIEMNPKTGKIVWEYKSWAHTGFSASYISGLQRLPNGNTLICSGCYGHLFEVTNKGEIVWEYINPVTREGPKTWIEDAEHPAMPPFGPKNAYNNNVFRAHRYGPNYPGLAGKQLVPKGQLAIDPKSGWRPKVDLTGATQPGVELWRNDWGLK